MHVKLYALPNILAGRELVPEFIQREAVPEKLGAAVDLYLSHRDKVISVRKALGAIHRSLRRNANRRAAEAVIKLLESRMDKKKPFLQQ